MNAQAGQRFKLENIRVIDGDTIEADVIVNRREEQPFFGTLIAIETSFTVPKQRIRILDLDTWESRMVNRANHRVTRSEIPLGKAATAALIDLINQSDEAVVEEEGRDAFGRLLGHIIVIKGTKETLVSDWMKEHGHDRRPAYRTTVPKPTDPASNESELPTGSD